MQSANEMQIKKDTLKIEKKNIVIHYMDGLDVGLTKLLNNNAAYACLKTLIQIKFTTNLIECWVLRQRLVKTIF